MYGLSFSPDGQFLASGYRDKTIRIWDMRQKPLNTIAILTGHSGRVTNVVYSPDGKYLAASSTDNTGRRYLARFEDVWQLAQKYVSRDLTPEERSSLVGEHP